MGDFGQGTFGLAPQPVKPAVRRRVARVRPKTPDTNVARAPAKAQETNVAHAPTKPQETKATPAAGIGGPFVSPPPPPAPQ
jgi:hypothetical protein